MNESNDNRTRAPRARSTLLFWFCGALVAAGCGPSTSDIKVNSAADPKADFAGYRSYAWAENAGLLRDQTGTWAPRNTDALAKVESLVDKKMQERGLFAADERPDLLVSLLMVADVDQVEQIRHARGGAVGPVDTVGEGALVIELIDRATGKTVWLGGAKGEVRSSRSVEEGNERLSYAVDRLFERVPR